MDTEDDRRPKFSDWLAQHRNGHLDDDLTATLAELAERVLFEGKPGSITLKLSLSEKGGGVIVAHEVKATAPKVKTEAFYYVDDGVLSSRDPNQPQLPYADTSERTQP
jgi:hypothetical protein